MPKITPRNVHWELEGSPGSDMNARFSLEEQVWKIKFKGQVNSLTLSVEFLEALRRLAEEGAA